MPVAVHPATFEHADALLDLLAELDHFYGATHLDPAEVRRRQLHQALFADPPSAHALLAWDDARLVGVATYSFLWPAAGLTRSLYLKELYVTGAARRTDVGQQLMQHLFALAAAEGCSRVEWTTDTDNPDAQRFYEALGLPAYPSKVFYRLDGEHLQQAARPDQPGAGQSAGEGHA